MTALPPLLSSGLLPKELDLASTTVTETEVEIIPLQSIERVRLLSGIYGPFKPPQPTRVPLWLAIYLRTKSKATILPPEWMSVASLQSHLQQEQRNPGFSDLPLHWIGVSNALLQSVASSDLEDSSQVRSLIKDLREIRQSKILAGIEMINPVHLEMTNIGLHEVAELRPFFKTAFDDLKAFSRLRYESQEAQ
ncbi:Psf2-domain-containing protein, partial [Violaceomyces palustris]